MQRNSNQQVLHAEPAPTKMENVVSMASSSYEAKQAREINMLKAIYLTDFFTDLSNENTRAFQIQLPADSLAEYYTLAPYESVRVTSNLDPDYHEKIKREQQLRERFTNRRQQRMIVLRVTYTARYPDEPPVIDVSLQPEEGTTAEDEAWLHDIQKELEKKAVEEVGRLMVSDLVARLQQMVWARSQPTNPQRSAALGTPTASTNEQRRMASTTTSTIPSSRSTYFDQQQGGFDGPPYHERISTDWYTTSERTYSIIEEYVEGRTDRYREIRPPEVRTDRYVERWVELYYPPRRGDPYVPMTRSVTTTTATRGEPAEEDITLEFIRSKASASDLGGEDAIFWSEDGTRCFFRQKVPQNAFERWMHDHNDVALAHDRPTHASHRGELYHIPKSLRGEPLLREWANAIFNNETFYLDEIRTWPAYRLNLDLDLNLTQQSPFFIEDEGWLPLISEFTRSFFSRYLPPQDIEDLVIVTSCHGSWKDEAASPTTVFKSGYRLYWPYLFVDLPMHRRFIAGLRQHLQRAKPTGYPNQPEGHTWDNIIDERNILHDHVRMFGSSKYRNGVDLGRKYGFACVARSGGIIDQQNTDRFKRATMMPSETSGEPRLPSQDLLFLLDLISTRALEHVYVFDDRREYQDPRPQLAALLRKVYVVTQDQTKICFLQKLA